MVVPMNTFTCRPAARNARRNAMPSWMCDESTRMSGFSAASARITGAQSGVYGL